MEQIRSFRTSKNMSMTVMAGLLGVNKATVSRWESGVRRIDIGMLGKVEKLTGISRKLLRPDIFGPAQPSRNK